MSSRLHVWMKTWHSSNTWRHITVWLRSCRPAWYQKGGVQMHGLLHSEIRELFRSLEGVPAAGVAKVAAKNECRDRASQSLLAVLFGIRKALTATGRALKRHELSSEGSG